MTEKHPTALAEAWRPGSTVFSARTLTGNEVLLWLVPSVDVVSFCEDLRVSHEVRFASMHPPVSRPPARDKVVELVPRWWVFESVCSPTRCSCGPRVLADVLASLPRRAAGQAFAAHIDLLAALLESTGRGPAPVEFAAAIAALRADLANTAVAVPA